MPREIDSDKINDQRMIICYKKGGGEQSGSCYLFKIHVEGYAKLIWNFSSFECFHKNYDFGGPENLFYKAVVGSSRTNLNGQEILWNS